MNELQEALAAEHRIALILDEIRGDLASEIEKAPLEGVREISQSPRCYAVSLRSVAATGSFVLSAKYYSPQAQADAVLKKLRGAAQMSKLLLCIEKMVERREVRCGADRIRLNPRTTEVLQRFLHANHIEPQR